MEPKQFREVLLRDLEILSKEIIAFSSEKDLWKISGTVKNPAGNLALHLVGNLNHFIGAAMGNTGYVRDRDAEFSARDVDRKDIISKINSCKNIISQALEHRSSTWLDDKFPILFNNLEKTNGEMLLILMTHFNYHLGQINYIRRIQN